MISIIIATYNRAKSLPKAIESILTQTFQDFEIIVIDDGSTDNTDQLFKNQFTDSRIRYIKLPKNKGATFARNTGLSEVKGAYFLVWDSDDILYPNALEIIMGIHEKNRNLAVVSTPARSLLNGKEISYKKVSTGIINKNLAICRSLPSNLKVRVASTARCGDIRYKAKNIDFLVNVEMSERGDWYIHSEYLADVILESDANSLTVQRKKTNLKLSILRAPYLAEYLDKYKDVLKKNCPGNYTGFSYGASIGFFAGKNKAQSRKFIVEALKTQFKIKYLFIYILNLVPFGLGIFKLMVWIKNSLT